jgi:hypothetical protein
MSNPVNFNNNLPAAPILTTNVQWQLDVATGNVSGNVPMGVVLATDFTNNGNQTYLNLESGNNIQLTYVGGLQGTVRIDNTAPAALPKTVGQLHTTGVAASILSTNVYAVAVSGMYRISMNLFTTTIGTAGTIFGNFGYQVTSGNRLGFNTPAITAAAALNNTAAIAQLMQTVYLVAGSNIDYSVTFSATTGTPVITVAVTVEQVM